MSVLKHTMLQGICLSPVVPSLLSVYENFIVISSSPRRDFSSSVLTASELKTEGREFHSHLELGIFPDLSGGRFLLLPNYEYFDKWMQSSSLFGGSFIEQTIYIRHKRRL